MNKLKIVDLFAGCGGLSLGFKNAGFKVKAHLEIDKKCIESLKLNKEKDELLIHRDINDIQSYINDLKNHINGDTLGIIGGPPCQAYSIAGRINKDNKMDEDPRNFLFESFIQIMDELQPKFFLFENVVGMLSAKPFGLDIASEISNSFKKSNFEINNNLRSCVFDMSDFGVPQVRKRVIIFGVNKVFFNNSEKIVKNFYNSMNKKKKNNIVTVRDSISDLPKIFPLNKPKKDSKIVYKVTKSYSEHVPRFHNQRDIKIFRILANDIENGDYKYTSTKALKKLYTKFTNRNSNVHKYHVLRWDKPSNTIPAHIYKDGLRHIHPDPEQARSITVREAARLMTFPDNYKFFGSMSDKYKAVGNAVPPLFSKVVAETIKEII